MSVILILLVLILIMLVLRLFIVKEGFQNIPLNPTTIQGYNNFLSFYNPFCDNWKKAIQSSVASEIPQQPLASPSQANSSQAPDIPESAMNTYIQQLSQQLSQPLPPICTQLPATIDSSSFPDILKQIPSDVTPYTNALNWMNSQLKKSQANLGSALQGLPIETFEDVCQNISACLANNPQLVQQLADELAQQNQQQITQEEAKLMSQISPFFQTPELTQALSQNVDLVQKAQDIQNQAQSGELINKINIPGGNSKINYVLPAGANNLNDMKQNNPERYNEIKQNYSSWFSVKQMLDGINSTL